MDGRLYPRVFLKMSEKLISQNTHKITAQSIFILGRFIYKLILRECLKYWFLTVADLFYVS